MVLTFDHLHRGDRVWLCQPQIRHVEPGCHRLHVGQWWDLTFLLQVSLAYFRLITDFMKMMRINFKFRNSVQLEKNILSGEVNLDHPSLALVSQEAKNFIRVLLVLDTRARWSASQCRAHKWVMWGSMKDSSEIERESIGWIILLLTLWLQLRLQSCLLAAITVTIKQTLDSWMYRERREER